MRKIDADFARKFWVAMNAKLPESRYVDRRAVIGWHDGKAAMYVWVNGKLAKPPYDIWIVAGSDKYIRQCVAIMNGSKKR